MDKDLKNALEKVLSIPADVGNNVYAIAYAEAALHHPYQGQEMEGRELKTQLLYVLNNLTYWRGEEARNTKAVLKKHAGLSK